MQLKQMCAPTRDREKHGLLFACRVCGWADVSDNYNGGYTGEAESKQHNGSGFKENKTAPLTV